MNPNLAGILNACAALMLVAACVKAQPSRAAQPAQAPDKGPVIPLDTVTLRKDTVALRQGNSVPVGGDLEIRLLEIVRKRVPPKRREILRAHLRIRVSLQESEMHLRSDGSWKSTQGWEFKLVGGSDSSATVVVRRGNPSPSSPPDSVFPDRDGIP